MIRTASFLSRAQQAAPLLALALCAFPALRAGAQTIITLYTFTGGADGEAPIGPLFQDPQGNLYGCTHYGGAAAGTDGYGTLFELDTAGGFHVLHTFTGGADGAYPYYGLIRDPQGAFYGVAFGGGDGVGFSGHGVIFKLDSAGNYSVLHTFQGNAIDGQGPAATLYLDKQGVLYGSTEGGAVDGNGNGWGTLFKLDSTGAFTVLYRFTGGADGGDPETALAPDSHGNLYGTASMAQRRLVDRRPAGAAGG